MFPLWSSHLQCCCNSHLSVLDIATPSILFQHPGPHTLSLGPPVLPKPALHSPIVSRYLLLLHTRPSPFLIPHLIYFISNPDISLIFLHNLFILPSLPITNSPLPLLFLPLQFLFLPCYPGLKLLIPSSVPPHSSLFPAQSPRWVETKHIILPNFLHFIPSY